MADYSLGTARGVIELEYKGGRAGAQAERDLDRIQQRSLGVHNALGTVSRTAGVAGIAIAGGLALAVRSAADFEKTISGISAVTGAVGKDLDAVRQKALQLGRDTKFSASEAALAMEELAKAGLSLPDIMNGAADATVALAAAGGIDLPQAATIASSAMNQFNLAAQDMPKVADLIAGAANASAIDVSQLGQSLQQVGAVAHLAGLSFGDTAAAIALMGNAGIRGSDAGTSLKTMLQNLQPVTKRQTSLFKELGIITKDGSNQFFDAQGNVKNLAGIGGVLQNALKGMTKEQKLLTLETMFGTDAIRAAAIIADEGAAGVNKMTAAMAKTTAAEVAAVRMDNFAGKMEEFKGSVETLAISIGSVLLPALSDIAEVATKAVNWFTSLPGPVQQAGVYAAAASASFLLLGAAFIQVIQFATKFAAAMRMLMGLKLVAIVLMNLKGVLWIVTSAVKAFSLALLMNPIGIAVVAIAALVAGLVLAYQKSETFRNIVNGVWAAIKAGVGAVFNWFTTTVWPGMQAVWNGILTGLRAMGAFFSSVWNGIKAIVSVVVKVIATIVMTYVNIWRTIITTALRAILAVWRGVWGMFGPLVKAVFELIKAIVQLAIRLIMFIIMSNLKAIQAAWRVAWNAIKAVSSAVWNVIKAVVTSAVNAVRAAITRVIGWARPYVTAAWNAIRSVTSSVWNAVSSVVSSVMNRIRSIVSSVVNAIRSVVSSAWNGVRSVTSSIWNGLVGVISGPLNRVLGVVRSIVGRVKGIFSGAASWLYQAGRNIIQGLINGVTGMISSFTSKIKSLTNMIPDLKGPEARDKRLLEPSGRWIMEGLIKGIEGQIPSLVRLLSGVTLTVPTSMAAVPMPARGPAPSPATQATATGNLAPLIGHQTVINPLAEPASQTAAREATRKALLGAVR